MGMGVWNQVFTNTQWAKQEEVDDVACRIERFKDLRETTQKFNDANRTINNSWRNTSTTSTSTSTTTATATATATATTN